jgi:alpha-beta hydrolase superfamily lysophospholipase
MRRSAFLVGGAALLGAGSVGSGPIAPSDRNVVLRASDGVHVYGVKRGPSANPVGVLLLFHQADSSADEYTPIAPTLVQMGYATLAIDQRSGGTLYGRNFTVAELGKSQP